MRGFDQVSLKLKLDLELAVFMIGPSLRCGVQWPTCYFIGSWATIVSTYVGILVGMKWCISLTGTNLPRCWLGICGVYINFFIGNVKTQRIISKHV